MASQENSIKHLKSQCYPSKTLSKIAEKGTLPNSLYKATITLIPKPDKDNINNKSYKKYIASVTDTVHKYIRRLKLKVISFVVFQALYIFKALLAISNCFLLLLLLSRFSRVRLCATPQTAAHQAAPSLGSSRQEHWSGLLPEVKTSLIICLLRDDNFKFLLLQILSLTKMLFKKFHELEFLLNIPRFFSEILAFYVLQNEKRQITNKI